MIDFLPNKYVKLILPNKFQLKIVENAKKNRNIFTAGKIGIDLICDPVDCRFQLLVRNHCPESLVMQCDFIHGFTFKYHTKIIKKMTNRPIFAIFVK